MKSDQKPRIVFRCDGGTDIGMGHVVRCIALADMLQSEYRVHLVIQETSESIYNLLNSADYSYTVLARQKDFSKDLNAFLLTIDTFDVVVLDGYHFTEAYQRGIKNKGHKLVVIDDLHCWHHYADVIVNHAGGVRVEDYSAEPYTEYCLGYDYRLLRAPFLQRGIVRKYSSPIQNFFISMGAADIHNNTMKFAKALLELNGEFRVNIMVSSLNPHLEEIELMAKDCGSRVVLNYNLTATELYSELMHSDMVIAPASTISMEACAAGVVLLTGTTALNQMDNYKGLMSAEVCFGIGDMNAVTAQEIQAKIEKIAIDIPKLNFQIEQQIVTFGSNPILNYQKVFGSLVKRK